MAADLIRPAGYGLCAAKLVSERLELPLMRGDGTKKLSSRGSICNHDTIDSVPCSNIDDDGDEVCVRLQVLCCKRPLANFLISR